LYNLLWKDTIVICHVHMVVVCDVTFVIHDCRFRLHVSIHIQYMVSILCVYRIKMAAKS
jgi:hypothetical protein